MPPLRPKIETVGFGFEPAGGAYHFVVTIPPGNADDTATVLVEEHFAYGESVEEAAARARFAEVSSGPPVRPPRPKVELALFRWQRIAEDVRAQFNRRLIGKEQKKAAWSVGENRLAPYLGRELVLLLWAIEDANPADIPNALANWQGLQPEERWWLYTTINAATGQAYEGRGRGWRRAIQIAFTENPLVENSESYFGRNSLPASRNGHRPAPAAPINEGKKGKRTRTQRTEDERAQPSLLDLNTDTDETRTLP